MSSRRPASTRRPSAMRRLSSLYTPIPISEDDSNDYPTNDDDDNDDAQYAPRPMHTRQTSRTALLTRASMATIRTLPRSIRRLSQADAFTNPVQLESIITKSASVDETTYRNADGEALDAQQRKMALVSEALEETGMGRYQWCIFVLCGFGYALDLAWAQAFGLIMPRVQIELGIPDERYGDIFAVFSCGLTLGAFFWGIAVDVIGRKWAFNLTVGITALFGSLLGAMDSYSAIVGLTLGVGFGLGGNIPIDATITLEFLPQKSRYLLVALSAFQPLGVILTSLICWRLIPAYSCADGLKACSASTSLVQALEGEALECCTKASNYGWRYSLFTLGFLSVLAFVARFVLFHFRESPRFLITQGRDAEAVDVCRHVALTNGKTPTLTLSMLEAIDAEDGAGGNETRHAEIVAEKALKSQVNVGHLARLFSSRKMTTLTLLAWAVYMADHWGFTIAGSFLPKILAERGADQGVGIDVTYRNYIIVSMAGAPGVLLGAVLVEIPQLGRKWAMVFSSAMMAASLLLYTTVTTFEGSVRLNAMEYFFQSTFNAILYGWTPEAFPAEVRGSASGLASFWGRLTSIVAPLIAQNAGTYGQLYLAGGGILLCTFLTTFLPDTRRVDVL